MNWLIGLAVLGAGAKGISLWMASRRRSEAADKALVSAFDRAHEIEQTYHASENEAQRMALSPQMKAAEAELVRQLIAQKRK